MDQADVYAILSQTLWAVLIASGPILALALVIGLVIAFFQALTQIQEMTLTFVPKIAAIFLGLILTLPFIFATLDRLAMHVFDIITSGTL